MSLLIRKLILSNQTATLRNSFNCNSIKVLALNTVILGVRVSTYDVWSTNIQSITPRGEIVVLPDPSLHKRDNQTVPGGTQPAAASSFPSVQP